MTPTQETLVQFNSTAYEDKECKLELIVENELEAGTVLRETSGERFYFFENGVVGADVGNVTERGTHFTIIGKELPKGTGNIASEVPDEFKPKSVSYPRLDTIEISNGEIVGIVYAAEDFRGEGIESDDLAMLTLDGDGGVVLVNIDGASAEEETFRDLKVSVGIQGLLKDTLVVYATELNKINIAFKVGKL